MRTAIIFSAIAATIALSSCSQTERGAAFGGATGATVGALASGTPGGAIVGGVIGAAGGALIGSIADDPGYCYYRDRAGRRYRDRC